MSGIFEFLRTNFLHVAPLLVAAAFAVAIIAERTKALFASYPIRDSESFFDRINELVMAGKVADAIALCDRYPGKPAARVVKQGLLRAHQPEGLIENGLQLAVGEATQLIQRRTGFLATIANVATLMGLFGTIAGLIQSFQAVGHADAQQKSAILAAGISTAMNATMLGLAVAIPCMIAFSFLMNRSNRLVAELDHSAVRTLDTLKQRYYSAETGAISGQEERFEQDDAPVSNGKQNGKIVNLRRAV
ncbi:MAG: MotA/TolQ/ExbB proton channel family protein [Oligoflexia bacterium]|nr:MotA/TolQ/ExbB proton channel family protein [Oligoflexia bacterium]